MNIPDYIITVFLAMVITLMTLGIGVFLLKRQKTAQIKITDEYTAFFEYKGKNKELPNKIMIYGSPLRIGRHEDCQIIIDDKRVSRRHALLEFEFDEEEKRYLYFLRDDDESDNGTHLNEKRLKKGEVVKLADHDVVAFGPVEYVFHQNLKNHVQSSDPTKVQAKSDPNYALGFDDNPDEILTNNHE